MKAVILAAGKGTRMKPISEEIPKCMVPIAHRPLLSYIVEKIRAAGIKEIAIVISPDSKIPNMLGEDVTYIVQKEPRGIADAVMCAKKFIGNSNFLLYLGDNYYNGSLKHLVDEDIILGLDDAVVLAAVSKTPQKYGVVEFDNIDSGEYELSRITEKPKNPKSKWISTGIYVLRPIIFKAIKNIKPSKRGELEITDAIQWLVDKEMAVAVKLAEDFWIDVGDPKSLHKLEKMINLEVLGQRIRLRDLRLSDIEGDYPKWLNDKEVVQYLESRFAPQTKTNIEGFVKKVLADENSIFLAIIDEETKLHIGNVKLMLNRIHRTAELGIVIGNKKFWGKGYATETIGAVTDYAFESLNLYKVTAGVYSNNLASINAFLNSGYEIEGKQIGQYICDGQRVDKILLGKVRK